jgi:hypothetical protein
LQRFSYGLPGYAEMLGEFALDKMLARPQRTRRDEFEQRVVDPFPERTRPLQLGHRTFRQSRGQHLCDS